VATAVVVDDTTAGAVGELLADGAEQAAADSGSDAQAPEEPVAPAETPEPRVVDVRDQTPVPISTLTRRRYVAPKYPRNAQRRQVQGWVDVVFTVAKDGTVKDVEVPKADPEGVFDNSAMRAVEKWEFDPVVVDGVVIEQRAGIRMMFALE